MESYPWGSLSASEKDQVILELARGLHNALAVIEMVVDEEEDGAVSDLRENIEHLMELMGDF